MAMAKANLRLLTERVNDVLDTAYADTYISSVRNGSRGGAALRRVVAQIEAEIMREAVDAAAASLETKAA
ncbi:MAG: hypothetical protein ABIW76_13175 [Fibrobacteria bacterium]